MAKLRLQEREKRMLFIGAAAVLVIMGWYVSRAPIEEYRRSRSQLAEARRNYAKAELYYEEIVENRQRQEALRAMLGEKRGFDLPSFLSGLLKERKLYERGAEVGTVPGAIKSPHLVGVQLTLRGVTLEELIDVLHELYASGNLIVLHKVDHIKESVSKKGLDCSIVLLAPKA